YRLSVINRVGAILSKSPACNMVTCRSRTRGARFRTVVDRAYHLPYEMHKRIPPLLRRAHGNRHFRNTSGVRSQGKQPDFGLFTTLLQALHRPFHEGPVVGAES